VSETTLVAIRIDTGERVAIGDVPTDTLRELSDQHLLRCPHCEGLLTLKAGPIRVHHFAHVTIEQCLHIDHEPETDSHRQGKLLLYQKFRQGALIAALEQHLPMTDQRADVFIEMPGPIGYALEFQQANNSVERWTRRHDLYRSLGINDIWFLGQVRYLERQSEPLGPISSYDPLPAPRDVFEAASGTFNARELEKAILAVEPMLYYLDPDSANLTILLLRTLQNNTLRAYHYRLPLSVCELRDGQLWTPLDPLLDEYRRYLGGRPS
jgi:Competence protein CoiA-like family